MKDIQMVKLEKASLLQAFPRALQKLVKQIIAQENYNEEYLLVSMLSATASATGNAARLRVKGEWVTCASMYTFLVGNPGQGKTPPLDFAYAPIYKRDEELKKKFLKLLEKVEGTKKRSQQLSTVSMPRTIVSDFTPEALMLAHDANPRGVAVHSDEIMAVFASVNRYNSSPLIEQLLSAYSGNPIDVMRVSMEHPIHISRPCINIVGTVQTDRVNELFNKGFLQNGLLDRFLFCYPEDTSLSLWGTRKVKKSEILVAEQWDIILAKILNLPYSPDDNKELVLHFSGAAQKAFYEWHDNGIKKISKGEVSEKEQGRMMKTHLHVARIALCIQLLKWTCEESDLVKVDVMSVRSAIQISEYFEDCYKRVALYAKRKRISLHVKMFLRGLSENFSTADAVAHGLSMGLSRSNVNYTLTKLLNLGIIGKCERGSYKVNKEFVGL